MNCKMILAASALALAALSSTRAQAQLGYEIELTNSWVTSVEANKDPRPTYIKETIVDFKNWLVTTDDTHGGKACPPEIEVNKGKTCWLGIIEIKNKNPIAKTPEAIKQNLEDLVELYAFLFQTCGVKDGCVLNYKTTGGHTYWFKLDTSEGAKENSQLNVDMPLSAFGADLTSALMHKNFGDYKAIAAQADHVFAGLAYDKAQANRLPFLRAWAYFVTRLKTIQNVTHQATANKNDINPNLKTDLCHLAQAAGLDFKVKSGTSVLDASKTIGSEPVWQMPFTNFAQGKNDKQIEAACRWTSNDVTNVNPKTHSENPAMVVELRHSEGSVCFAAAEMLVMRGKFVNFKSVTHQEKASAMPTKIELAKFSSEAFASVKAKIDQKARDCFASLP